MPLKHGHIHKVLAANDLLCDAIPHGVIGGDLAVELTKIRPERVAKLREGLRMLQDVSREIKDSALGAEE